MRDILKAIAGGPAALATLVQVEGSSYRLVGARELLTPDGARVGSVSGGCIEDDLMARMRRVLESGESELAVYDTTADGDLVWGTGSGCRGVIRIFIERISQPPPAWVAAMREHFRAKQDTALTVVYGDCDRTLFGTRLASELPPLPAGAAVFRETMEPPLPLVIFGAGDDAQPLAQFARKLGWSVTVFDSRPAYATPERFPGIDAVIVAPAEEAAERVPLGSRTRAVIMTHRYGIDVPLLRLLLPLPIAYLGVLGPRERTEQILAELMAEGMVVTADMRARLFAPVGLDLGSATPETVALSILAELQAHRAGRPAIHLRERRAPIHA